MCTIVSKIFHNIICSITCLKIWNKYNFVQILDNEKLFTSDAFKDVQSNSFKSVTLNDKNIDDEPCSDGKSTENMLDPCSNSDESFSIDYNANTSETSLVLENTMEVFNEYCLVVNEDLTYSAHICRKKNVGVLTKERYRYLIEFTFFLFRSTIYRVTPLTCG